MASTIAAILIVVWFLGVLTAYTLDGFIHLLLLAAAIIVVVRFVRRRP